MLAPEPPLVLASEAHVLRALSNLVRNATEAMEHRGTVAVKTRARVTRSPTARSDEEAAEYAVVMVSDTGAGIPEEELSRHSVWRGQDPGGGRRKHPLGPQASSVAPQYE